ncbi:mannitol dehydrogenase family protein [Roseomonas sp. KE2513]|uniref:mannitol dehydrogenase family protein n=1 Tax=Roseomonas sp. KE2513 TaxID=2479202 RepID=UPI0018DF923F|nr:mannitol dehydrogenase family protein [Roseomonas sp. KE2513]MBI0539596.1 mannitol dehydrogenase family protein [Roseomonas sp. KE2513]
MPRLSPQALAAHPPGAHVALPRYNRARLSPAIVHLGLGAFFRAHVALYTEDVLNARGGDWGIVGVSLQRPDQRDRLVPQGGLYTTLERGPGGDRARIVGNLLDVRVAPEEPDGVLSLLAAPGTRIVSLTVTEKGYCHDPATGSLREDHPDILHDLGAPDAPRTAVGFLTAALRRRREAGLRPFTVLCCDNLPRNGALLRELVRDFAALSDPDLAGWIAETVSFPSSMVDRIVPALGEQDLAAAQAATGLADLAPVMHEPFRQWVIEDRFAGGDRPAWDLAGAVFTEDVGPFEHMKLRLLNGAHSALAYLGCLAGHETIVAAVGDPALAAYAQRLWTEIRPMIPPPPGQDLATYTDDLLARFGNPAIHHRTSQIAADGSQKLPQRLLSTVRERLAAKLPIPALALAVAAWARYVGGIDEAGRALEVRDPMAPAFRAALDAAGNDPDVRLSALLGLRSIFGTDLPVHAEFRGAVAAAYKRLLTAGARAAAAADPLS